MIRVLLAAMFFSLAAGVAQAQFRTIPDDAKRANISHVQGMTVEIDGQRAELAAGAQIRDADNRIVLPTALPAGALVKIKTDLHGQPWRIWILSPQEAAQPDPKK